LPEDSERVRRLFEFKKKLENRIETLSSDLKDAQALLETIDSLLIEKGFKRLEVTTESAGTEIQQPTGRLDERSPRASPHQPDLEVGTATPLQTMSGEFLANLYANKDLLRVVMAEDKNFSINTPPFTHFLVERVLFRMQERDNELVRAGQLSPENVICYNIIREGDTIREIIIKNTDPDRLKELKSSIRWTLEKMYEKTKSQN
jgi:hypothetical protein